MYSFALYDEAYDEIYKWQSFPYWEARPRLGESSESVRSALA